MSNRKEIKAGIDDLKDRRQSDVSVRVSQIDAQQASSNIERKTNLDIYADPIHARKTGIVCTIGPASNKVDILLKMLGHGMAVARLNFSHGDHESHAETIRVVREAAKKFDRPVAIALDTKGPEIRTGLLVGYDENPRVSVVLESGAAVTITTDPGNRTKCTKDLIYVDYANITKVVDVGSLIYIDDGLLSLKVEKKVDDTSLQCIVQNDGKLGSRKGVNLPQVEVDLPAVSEKDRGDLLFGVEQGVDMVFASFIRKREDVEAIREVLGEKGKSIHIISKIENHEGVQKFDEILAASDGIMVARGDLGIEILPEKVFLAQKMMIAKCNLVGKPVICATQMLDSMIRAPRPTRAEVSDVANAVLDGADCVMLSGETAGGDFPVESVEIMGRICMEAEGSLQYVQFRDELRHMTPRPMKTTEAIAIASVDAAYASDAGGIICLTISGRTARLMSKWRPTCPIVAITRHPHAARLSRLYYGVTPMFYKSPKKESDSWSQDIDNRFYWAMQQGLERGLWKKGDTIVGVHGWQSGAGFTNTIRILVVQ